MTQEKKPGLKDEMNNEDFYVCPNHQSTGGYESCCACSEGRQCTEAQNDESE